MTTQELRETQEAGYRDALYGVVAAVLRGWPGGVTEGMLGGDLCWPDTPENGRRLLEQLNRLLEAGYVQKRAATELDEPGGDVVWSLTQPGWQHSLGCKRALLLLANVNLGD